MAKLQKCGNAPPQPLHPHPLPPYTLPHYTNIHVCVLSRHVCVYVCISCRNGVWHGSTGTHSGVAKATEDCSSWSSSSVELTGRASLFTHPLMGAGGNHTQRDSDHIATREHRAKSNPLLVRCDSADMAFLCVHLTHLPSRSEAF